MKTFLFIFLAGYAVKCDDNYYVVQMPERSTSQPREFRVYWNVPTMQCKSKRIPFNNLLEKYGIIQNANDTHRGDMISILYDPGFFPALVKNESTGEIRYRNGGVPQQGDLMEHLQVFKYEMEKSIPDENFNGVGIIDFESWRPVLRQNFGVLTPYKDVSYDIEKKRHWWWKKQWIQEEAKRRFESSGRDFMQTTLALARKMRPKALWGYYGYPQCFNRPVNSNVEKCAKDMPAENDQADWLWSESTALYPSVYSAAGLSPAQLGAFIRGRIKESVRVRVKGTPILPYWWFRYRDGGYFSETDLEVSFNTFYKSNVTGFIIWGSSKDVNTVEKCQKLKAYVTNILGPAIAKYTKPDTRLEDPPVEISYTTYIPDISTKLDPEYHWEPPVNYSQNIEHIVDEELQKENNTNIDNDKAIVNESALIDLVLHKIADYCAENCHGKHKVTELVGTEAPVVLTTKDPFKETTVKLQTTVKPQTTVTYLQTTPVSTTTPEFDIAYDYTDTSTITIRDPNDPDDDVTSSSSTVSTDATSSTNDASTTDSSKTTNSIEAIDENGIDTTTSATNAIEKVIEENFSIYDTSGTNINDNDVIFNETKLDSDIVEDDGTTENWNAIDSVLKSMLSVSKGVTNDTNDAINTTNDAINATYGTIDNINSAIDNAYGATTNGIDTTNSAIDNKNGVTDNTLSVTDYTNSVTDYTDSAIDTTSVPVSTEQVSGTLTGAATAPVASMLAYLVIYLRSIIHVCS